MMKEMSKANRIVNSSDKRHKADMYQNDSTNVNNAI